MTIRTRPSTAAYAEGWDRIFGKTPKTVTVEAIEFMRENYRIPYTNEPCLGWSVTDLTNTVTLG